MDPRARRTRRGVPAAAARAAAGPGPVTAPAGAPPAVPSFAPRFVIVLENRDYATALADPGVAALARRWALATNYYAVAHPSLPNYLALAGGATFGVTSDCVTCYVTAPNLASQLGAAGVSFGAYLEGAPRTCFLAPYGGTGYAAKHNPFQYFTNVRASASLCARLHPLRALGPQLGGPAARVPRVVWITPNLCHDGHDCATATASAWLRGEVGAITRSAAWRAGGALFVTWDEVVGAAGVAPGLARGLRVATPLNHYSLLATVEDAVGVARL